LYILLRRTPCNPTHIMSEDWKEIYDNTPIIGYDTELDIATQVTFVYVCIILHDCSIATTNPSIHRCG